MVIIEGIENLLKSFFIEFPIIPQVAEGVFNEPTALFSVKVAAVVIIIVVPDFFDYRFDRLVLGGLAFLILAHEHGEVNRSLHSLSIPSFKFCFELLFLFLLKFDKVYFAILAFFFS